jgi:hypothetical protein
LNEWRSKLGLTPLRGSLFKKIAEQRIPIVHAYSPSLVSHPKDWHENNFISGQLKQDVTHLPEQASSDSNADLDQWLDRDCSCVIHHGGAGTTHATLESGTPSIICSTYADQPFWGERITDLNIGRHIPFPALDRTTSSDSPHL